MKLVSILQQHHHGNLVFFGGGYGPDQVTSNVVDIYNTQSKYLDNFKIDSPRLGLATTSSGNLCCFFWRI